MYLPPFGSFVMAIFIKALDTFHKPVAMPSLNPHSHIDASCLVTFDEGENLSCLFVRRLQ
jgi:hypothetical protein